MIPFHFGGQKWIAYVARVSLRRTAIFFSNGINLRNFFFHRTCMLSGVYLKYFPVRKFCSKFIWILALYENFNSETRQLDHLHEVELKPFIWIWLHHFNCLADIFVWNLRNVLIGRWEFLLMHSHLEQLMNAINVFKCIYASIFLIWRYLPVYRKIECDYRVMKLTRVSTFTYF